MRARFGARGLRGLRPAGSPVRSRRPWFATRERPRGALPVLFNPAMAMGVAPEQPPARGGDRRRPGASGPQSFLSAASRSDVDDEPGPPATPGLLKQELMERHGLGIGSQHRPLGINEAAARVGLELERARPVDPDLRCREDLTVAVLEEDELG